MSWTPCSTSIPPWASPVSHIMTFTARNLPQAPASVLCLSSVQVPYSTRTMEDMPKSAHMYRGWNIRPTMLIEHVWSRTHVFRKWKEAWGSSSSPLSTVILLSVILYVGTVSMEYRNFAKKEPYFERIPVITLVLRTTVQQTTSFFSSYLSKSPLASSYKTYIDNNRSSVSHM